MNHGISHEVGEDLRQAVPIPTYKHPRSYVTADGPVRMGDDRVVHNVLDQPGHINAVVSHGATLIEIGEQKQVINQPSHSCGFCANAPHCISSLSFVGEGTFALKIEISPDRCQRCAQFMRRVRDKGAQSIFRPFALIEHLVERGPQLSGFCSDTRMFDAYRTISAQLTLGHFSKRAYGSQAESGDPRGNEGQQGKRSEDSHQSGTNQLLLGFDNPCGRKPEGQTFAGARTLDHPNTKRGPTTKRRSVNGTIKLHGAVKQLRVELRSAE